MKRSPGLLSLSLVLVAGCGTNNSPADMAALPDLATPDLAQGTSCTAAVQQVLAPVDSVSTGVVNVLSDMNGVKTVYVDASAGGINVADTHPRLYLALSTATAVSVTDKTAHASTAWDLALKRPVLFTNDGDGGSGTGGSLEVKKAFDQVTAADAMNQTFSTESFVDKDCNPLTDQAGEVLTSMSDWYDYDLQTNVLTPKANTTWIIRGGTGTLWKVGIQDYYSTPTGMMGMSGGHYLLQIGAL